MDVNLQYQIYKYIGSHLKLNFLLNTTQIGLDNIENIK